MPFGKRGLIGVDEEPPESVVSFPVLPPNATTLQWLTGFWKLCKMLPGGLGQGVVSYGYHILATVVLTIAIFFINLDILTRFAEIVAPYWPLLAKVRPYMDAHGRHALYLYMSAMFFKDMALVVFFSVRNLFWAIASFIMLSSKTKIRFRPETCLYGFIAPSVLAFFMSQLYYGPDSAPGGFMLGSVYFGHVSRGLIFPALLVYPMLVLFSFYSVFLIFFPDVEGESESLSKINQIRNLK